VAHIRSSEHNNQFMTLI